MKTKDAFAFQKFNAKRIFFVKFFDEFMYSSVNNIDDADNDEDILEEFKFENIALAKTFQTLYSLKQISLYLDDYQKRILRHGERILKIANKIASKIADDTNAPEKVKKLYQRAKKLYQQYLKISDKVGDLKGTVEDMINDNGKKTEKALCLQFGRNLKNARIKASMTQQELAFQSNTPAPDISKFENGRKFPAYVTLVKLADALGVTSNDLIY